MPEHPMPEHPFVSCWRYHAQHPAKIVTTQEDLEQAEAEGWRDSPAAASAHYKDANGVVATLEAAEAAVERGDNGAIEDALGGAEDAIERVQRAVNRKPRR